MLIIGSIAQLQHLLSFSWWTLYMDYLEKVYAATLVRVLRERRG